jgi:alkanesulfonate monooxygenase SsuD/methylene tetrahydromethanopterin reductase-like flavin-dependent oxidoreductase (luciferase family)
MKDRHVICAAQDGAHGFYFHVMRTKLASFGALDLLRDYPDQPDSELSPTRCMERLVIAGTPESVADQILAFRTEVGAFGTLLYTGHDWADPWLARRSMELTANEVWPRIERAVRRTPPEVAAESAGP